MPCTHPPLAHDPRDIPERVRGVVLDAQAEGEQQRRLPSAAAEALRAAGAFRLLTPVELGGFECDLVTALCVFEDLARLDGSVAWNVWNGNLGFSAALLAPDGVAEIWGAHPDPIIANSARPVGVAHPTDAGAFALHGRWDIVSAADAADWIALFGIVTDPATGGPAFVAPGVPDIRAFYVRRDEVQIVDTWRVTGMRGTGSNTVVADGVAVPGHRAVSPFAPAHIDRPLYRIPAFTLASTGAAGAVLGMARSAIDAIVDLAPGKATDNGQPLQLRAHAQRAVAQADVALRAARLALHDAAASVHAAATAGEVTVPDRARLRAAMVHAGVTSREVAVAMHTLAGSTAIYDGQRIERVFRDTVVATQHALLQETHLETAGRVLFGLDPGVPVF